MGRRPTVRGIESVIALNHVKDHMDVGDRVENFTLEDQDGRPVSLDSLLESGPLVVYFYIKAMTPG